MSIYFLKTGDKNILPSSDAWLNDRTMDAKGCRSGASLQDTINTRELSISLELSKESKTY